MMLPPKLDARLEAALKMGEPCATFADIGADHGRLSAVLLTRDPARRGLVTDISPKALNKAALCLHRLGLSDRVELITADGLQALHSPVDTVFILGMGGDTIRQILLEGRETLRAKALVLSPHTEETLVRRAVQEIGWRVRKEQIVLDAGRRYLVMRCEPATPGEPAHTEQELLLGPCLLRLLPPEWLPVLMRKERLLSQGIAAMEKAALPKDVDRLARQRVELDRVRAAIERYENQKTGGNAP